MNLPTNLIIRSQDRDLYSQTQSTSNFSISLPSNIKNASRMCLVNAMIPYTFYNIMNKNNTFLIDDFLITITPGNYNLIELGSAVETAIRSIGGTYSSFSISYNSLTSQSIFSNSTPFDLDFQERKIAPIFGFNQQFYPSATNLSSIYPVNISPLAIIIHIDCGSGMSTSSKAIGSGTFIIPVNVNKSEIIQINDKTNYLLESKINSQLINNLNIRVTDLDNNQLQGLGEWHFILKFEHYDTREQNVNIKLCGSN